MNFTEWAKGTKAKDALLLDPTVPDVDQTIIAPLHPREAVDRALKNGSSVWTPEVQALETFRRSRLCDPPYKKPGWRPKA